MKYKSGDTVKIKSYQWYNANKDCHGDVYNCKKIFNSTMSIYCGNEMTIEEVDEEGQFYYDSTIKKAHVLQSCDELMKSAYFLVNFC